MSAEANQITDGIAAISEKMKSERPTLREYLRSRASGESQSAAQWEKEFPGCQQAAYRAGSSNAYLDIERMLEKNGFQRKQFSPEDLFVMWSGLLEGWKLLPDHQKQSWQILADIVNKEIAL